MTWTLSRLQLRRATTILLVSIGGLAVAPAGANAAAGALDTSFGESGFVETGAVRAIAPAPDGSLYVAGGENWESQTNRVIYHVLPSGQVDSAYGEDGAAVVPRRSATLGWTGDGVLGADGQGRVVGSGKIFDGNQWVGYLFRLTEEGKLDASFGDDGYLYLNDFFPLDILVRADGRMVLSFECRYENAGGCGAHDDLRVMALNPDGTMDTAFGEGGFAEVNPGTMTIARSLTEGPGGTILGIGFEDSKGWGVFRLLRDGTADPSLGEQLSPGWANTVRDSLRPGDLAVGPDQSITVAGITDSSAFRPPRVSRVDRLNWDGTADTSFGTGGVQVSQLTPWGDHPSRVVVQPDRKIVLLGNSSWSETPTAVTVSRLNADGSTDLGFADCGSWFSHQNEHFGRGLHLNQDGGIVFGGTFGLSRLEGGQSAPASAEDCASGPAPPAKEPAGKPPSEPSGSGGVAGGVAAGGRGVQVHKLLSPRSFRKLASRGIRALVSCELDCRAVVEVRVPTGVAADIGLPGTLVAQGSRRLDAGKRGWVMATLRGGARRALRSYTGGGNFKVKVRGVAP